MLPWVFYIVMNLPSFGGPILATVQLSDEASCRAFHKVVSKEIKDMGFNYVVLDCVVKPAEPK